MQGPGPDDDDLFRSAGEVGHLPGVHHLADDFDGMPGCVLMGRQGLVGDHHEVSRRLSFPVRMVGRVERVGLNVDPVDDPLPFDHVDDPTDNHHFSDIIIWRLQKTGQTNRGVCLPDLVGRKRGRPRTVRKDQKGEKEIKFSSLEKCSDH